MSELEFWKDLGNIFDAVLNYQKKNVEFNNRFINPWIRLGNIFDRQDQTNDAVEAYKHATEIDPDSAQNWNDLGDAQFKKGVFDEAAVSYRVAVELDPEAGWPLGNLALSLVTQGRVEEAIPLYKQSIELLTEVKDKAICWNRLGNAYRKLNDYENAFLSFETADHLDGENTGFNDKLDETPPGTPVIAPEEILEQMIVEQALEEAEAAAPEAVIEPADDPTQLEVDPAESNVSQVESVDVLVALAPNMEMIVEEEALEDEIAQPLDDTGEEAEEESPLHRHEKNFDLLQIVENVIAKVEQHFAAQEIAEANQEAEEISIEVELAVVSDEVEDETLVMSEDVSIEDEVSAASEEATREIESALPEFNEDAQLEAESPVENEAGEEEQVSVTAPRRVPEWLVIKAEEKETSVKTQEEEALVESVATLLDISQEAAVSESAVNMDVVETFTDPLAAQLTTEPSLSEEIFQEIGDQPTVKMEAEPEAQEMIEAGESAFVEESSAVVIEEQAAELAYEEYLKDAAEPANVLTDHVDEMQSEAPITKVSKDGEVRIAMDTKNAHVWNELGNIYLNASACDDAIASYSKAIELDRQFAWPYSNLALAYVQKGRFAEAILLYQRGIELFNSDKDKAITWNRLGNVYRRINDYGNAISAYQTADELDPENATLSLRSSFGLLGNMYSDPKPAYVA